jgi:hypothetical protein
VTAVGELTECEESYCLEDMPLDLSAAGEPTDPAAADFDGDGTVATVSEELAGLVGQYVELSVVEYSDPLEVVELNRFALAPE